MKDSVAVRGIYSDPLARVIIRLFIGSGSYQNAISRYCFWASARWTNSRTNTEKNSEGIDCNDPIVRGRRVQGDFMGHAITEIPMCLLLSLLSKKSG